MWTGYASVRVYARVCGFMCVGKRGRHRGTRACGYACACLRNGVWRMYGLVGEYARE